MISLEENQNLAIFALYLRSFLGATQTKELVRTNKKHVVLQLKNNNITFA